MLKEDVVMEKPVRRLLYILNEVKNCGKGLTDICRDIKKRLNLKTLTIKYGNDKKCIVELHNNTKYVIRKDKDDIILEIQDFDEKPLNNKEK